MPFFLKSKVVFTVELKFLILTFSNANQKKILSVCDFKDFLGSIPDIFACILEGYKVYSSFFWLKKSN